MSRHRVLSFVMALFVISLVLPGCSQGPSEEELAKAALNEQLAAIEQSYEELQTTRTEFDATSARLAELEAMSKLDDEQQAEKDALAPRVDELATARDAAFETLQNQLAEFLNLALNNFPQAAETVRALEIYSTEGLLTADDIVAKSGDYSKAMDQLRSIQSYYESVGLEPLPALETAIASYDDWRFITQERFDLVKKNMTKDEVREIAGVPYYHNIQVDEQRGVETWLYKKREGGAAAVYFKTNNDKVYATNFDAIKTKVVE
jgi:prefoldin subunit 5